MMVVIGGCNEVLSGNHMCGSKLAGAPVSEQLLLHEIRVTLTRSWCVEKCKNKSPSSSHILPITQAPQSGLLTDGEWLENDWSNIFSLQPRFPCLTQFICWEETTPTRSQITSR
jgi:hypothetical protein